MNSKTRLTRSTDDKIIAGVCGGLADYFGIDSTIVRLVFVIAVLSGVSPIIYLILWLVMPRTAVTPLAPTSVVQPQLPVSQPTTQHAPSYYEGQENWKYDPITGEQIQR
jgi:phage shock protein C